MQTPDFGWYTLNKRQHDNTLHTCLYGWCTMVKHRWSIESLPNLVEILQAKHDKLDQEKNIFCGKMIDQDLFWLCQFSTKSTTILLSKNAPPTHNTLFTEGVIYNRVQCAGFVMCLQVMLNSKRNYNLPSQTCFMVHWSKN